MTDLHALIHRMADELDHYRQCLLDDRRVTHPLADEARAALAKPEPEGPTDDELNEPLGDLIDKWCQEGMRVKPHGTSFPLAHYVASKSYQYGLRKGRPTRAADLLEQRQGGAEEPSVAAPVPVSEGLPGPELCWWFEADEDRGYGSNWTLLRIRGSATGYTHWLPAHALPVPNHD